MNRAVFRERTLRPPALVLAATLLVALALAVMAVAAVLAHQAGNLELIPIKFVMGSRLPFPHELTTFVPSLKDGALPIPSL